MKKTASILDHILDALPDRETRFVFPSAVPAQFLAREAALRGGIPLGEGRFIAWDDFKAETLSARLRDKKAANQALRTLFASALLEENAAAEAPAGPFLREFVNPVYARNFEAFVPQLSKVLPTLDSLIRDIPEKTRAADSYFGDLVLIRDRYRRFLEIQGFYEPSWGRSPFDPGESRWILFFPELADDWEEYEAELSQRAAAQDGAVRIVPLSGLAVPGIRSDPFRSGGETAERLLAGYRGCFVHCSSMQEEFRWLARTVRQLIHEGLVPEDIVISMAGLSSFHEQLSLEFMLRDIPLDIHWGKPIPQHPGGRIFAGIAACPAEKWSFRALKNLLLDKSIPWKDPESINLLIAFGLRYRCVSGFTDRTKTVDVWEESFRRLWDNEGPVQLPVSKIRKFYRTLKKDIQELVNARSFAQLAVKWQDFSENHIDRSGFAEETDKVIARAIDSLGELVELEDSLQNRSGASPYSVFQAYLRDQSYVFRTGRRGVAVYDYRVAAGITPAVHFIVNVNQDEATIRSSGAPFLREDRRQRLRIRDRDLSGDFIRAYGVSGTYTVFSVSGQTFSGPALPHRMLFELLPAGEAAPDLSGMNGQDPLELEETLIRGGPASGTAVPPTSVQKRGWESFRTAAAQKDRVDFRKDGCLSPELASAVGARLTEKEGRSRLSPTDLNEFLRCPFAWMLQRGLGIWDKQTEIETIDQRDLGILYHTILERFFLRLKNSGDPFLADRLPEYKTIMREEIAAALEDARSREGAFQESVYGMLTDRIYAALSDYLDNDAEIIDRSAILGPEFPLRKTYASAEIALSGIADLLLQDKNGSYVLTDFKTGRIPAAAELAADGDDSVPANVQMAAYIGMAESGGKPKVRTARFYSLDQRKYQKLVDDEAPPRSNLLFPVPREGYENEVLAVDRLFSQVLDHIGGGRYPVPDAGSRWVCADCRVSSVCRIPFMGGE
ncbi:PD-(D/E)XK nuclease family protein [Breznakiella homolactica]|uniref:PD-(D/E)XK nuclease family protein n=1 Tax=Breznakiella homolactica TaxID=2798577 RepID=A0A7T8B9R8_9SPIR|nr:PD-(D/E)XK nuclease family protein [Breznakiella homolactica]QQO09889.1 PD-(D/E)XK nuclease family protein [Breznakiella homolactica]